MPQPSNRETPTPTTVKSGSNSGLGTFGGIFTPSILTILGVTVLVAILALTSAEVAIKTQYIIMTAIALSLISLVLSSPLENTQIEPWGTPNRHVSN